MTALHTMADTRRAEACDAAVPVAAVVICRTISMNFNVKCQRIVLGQKKVTDKSNVDCRSVIAKTGRLILPNCSLIRGHIAVDREYGVPA